ncbi:hypothetical protein [Saccharothrix luteola]|uniref:hypothetical protein n=1 Tax=Saccharothrix luteola TaxID=2893018 RepID=UPI001E5F0740|nr:hypothetical protein [Saccharothrix luteola]MCC8251561.1 hypothetical protein [Saccharothrix luteola]
MSGVGGAIERFAAFLNGDSPPPTPPELAVQSADDRELGTMACIVTASAWYADQAGSSELVRLMLTRAVELGAVVDEFRPLVDVVLDDLDLYECAVAALGQIDAFVTDCADASLDEAIGVLGEFRDGGHRLTIRSTCIKALLTALWLRWQDSGRAEDLDEVITTGGEGDDLVRAALAERGDGDRDVWRQVRLGIAMKLRGARTAAFERTRDIVHLNEVVRLGTVAMPFMPRDDKPFLIASHADALQTRYHLTGTVEDLDDAIAGRRRQRILFPQNEEGWFHASAMLCELLHARREIAEVATDLDGLIDLNEDLLRDERIQHEHRTELAWIQARRLRERWTRTGFADDLGRAAALARELAGQTTEPGLLSSLGFMLFEWASLTGDGDDLRLSIDLGRRSASSPGPPRDQGRRLSNLFVAEVRLAEETGQIEEFDAAIATARATVALFGESEPEHAEFLVNVAAGLRGRFQLSGSEDDLGQALHCTRAALSRSIGDAGRMRCGALLVLLLADRLDRFGDPAAFDEAKQVIEQGLHLDPAWLGSISHLGEVVGRRGAEHGIDPRAGKALLSLLNRGILESCVEMAGVGARARNPAVLELAMSALKTAESLGGAPDPAIYTGLRGQILFRQWQISGVRADLDTAIALLLDAVSATERSAPVWASDNLKDAAYLLYRRYRRRSHRADLEESCRLLERALPLAEDGTELRATVEERLHRQRRQLANAPMMLVHSDVGEVDREGLSSSYGMSALQAWNRGEPRESGLSWVRAGGDVTADPGSPRVLFLRTFTGDDTAYKVIDSLAAALGGGAGRIEIVSDQRDRDAIDPRVDIIPATRENWRRVVLERMFAADAIVLYLSPKDIDFPEFPFADSRHRIATGEEMHDALVDAPMSRPITGPGLLREVAYLNRANMLPITVLVCGEQYQGTLNDLIALAGAMGDATDPAGNFLTPRFTATDKQVGHLHKAYRGISFQHEEGALPGLAEVIRTALADMRTENITRQPVPWRLQDLWGRSPEPRNLPPDNVAKIIEFSDVEELLFLPEGEITEISHDGMLVVLDREAIAHGCPHCRAATDRIFFFVEGLHSAQELAETGPATAKARCQVCGRRSSYLGFGHLEPM